MQHLESGSNPKIIFLEFHASFSRLIEDSNFIWIDYQNWVGKVYIQKLFWFHEVFLTLERKKSSSNQFNYEIEVQYN